MSFKQVFNIKCPVCGTTHKHEVWSSVNTKLNPEQKERVLSGVIFYDECPGCHNSIRYNNNFLYHDQEKRYMIMLSEQGNAEKELDKTKELTLSAFNKEDYYTLRLVRTVPELVEKINIFDNDLDDRIVEFCKYVMKKSVIDNYKINNIGYSRFEIVDKQKKIMFYNKENKAVAIIDFDEVLKQLFNEDSFRNNTTFTDNKYLRYVIDEDWIKGLLHYLQIYNFD